MQIKKAHTVQKSAFVQKRVEMERTRLRRANSATAITIVPGPYGHMSGFDWRACCDRVCRREQDENERGNVQKETFHKLAFNGTQCEMKSVRHS